MSKAHSRSRFTFIKVGIGSYEKYMWKAGASLSCQGIHRTPLHTCICNLDRLPLFVLIVTFFGIKWEWHVWAASMWELSLLRDAFSRNAQKLPSTCGMCSYDVIVRGGRCLLSRLLSSPSAWHMFPSARSPLQGWTWMGLLSCSLCNVFPLHWVW